MMIANPIDRQEEDFYFPIASEDAFWTEWQPLIDRLPVKWAKGFGCGVEIPKADFAQVLEELQAILRAIPDTMPQTRKQQMEQRIQNLCGEILKLQKSNRDNLRIWVG